MNIMNSPNTEAKDNQKDRNDSAMPAVKCATEYDTLRRVVLCEPKYMAIKDIINDVQKDIKMKTSIVQKRCNNMRNLKRNLRNTKSK